MCKKNISFVYLQGTDHGLKYFCVPDISSQKIFFDHNVETETQQIKQIEQYALKNLNKLLHRKKPISFYEVNKKMDESKFIHTFVIKK